MSDVVIPKRPPSPARGITSRQVDRGSGLQKNVVVSATALDLSAAASSEDFFVTNTDVYIQAFRVWYVEATSADAGVLVKLGTPADDDAYASITSDISKAANANVDESAALPATAAGRKLAAGTLLRLTSAGSKTGTGTVRCSVEYSVADE